MESQEATDKAHDIMSWIENAVGDLGDELAADKMYEDVDAMCDLGWDQIHDSARTEEDRLQVAKAIIEQSYHEPLKTACKKYIARFKRRKQNVVR